MTKSLLSLLALGALALGPASSTPPPAETFTGCVQRSPDDKTVLVMSGKNFCVRLTGTLSADKLAAHTVTLRGTMVPATASQPAEIRVLSVTTIGDPCTDSCSLVPPGHRGIGKKQGEIPGREGGTPGAHSPTPLPPP